MNPMNPGSHPQVIRENVNIEKLPQKVIAAPGEFTEGDLHGNAVKLLYILAKYNIATAPDLKEKYEQLIAIYKKPTAVLTSQDIDNFKNILNQIQFNNESHLRLIGDELCDRGMNDIFTLLIFEKMSQEDVSFDILLSNHGIEFLEAFHQGDFSQSGIDSAYSMYNMNELLIKEVIQIDQVRDIVNTHYKKCIKLIDYELNKDGTQLKIFTHAPSDLRAIRYAAKYLNIEYKASTVNELMNTIDLINEKISYYIQTDKVYKLFSKTIYDSDDEKLKENPIYYLLWNRNWLHLQPQEPIENCSIIFVNGHDTPAPKSETQGQFYQNNKNRIFLNNGLGYTHRGNPYQPTTFSSGEHAYLYAPNTELSLDYIKRKKLQSEKKLLHLIDVLKKENKHLKTIVNAMAQPSIPNVNADPLESEADVHLDKLRFLIHESRQLHAEAREKEAGYQQLKDGLIPLIQNHNNSTQMKTQLINKIAALELQHTTLQNNLERIKNGKADKVLQLALNQEMHTKADELRQKMEELTAIKNTLLKTIEQNQSQHKEAAAMPIAPENASRIELLQHEISELKKEKARHITDLNCVPVIEKFKSQTDRYLLHLARKIKKSLNVKLEVDAKNIPMLINEINKLYLKPEHAPSLLKTKFEALTKLYERLQINETNPTQKVVGFYTLLKDYDNTIAKHRDPMWQRYAARALKTCAVVLTGIVPGLLYLGVQALRGKKIGFWENASCGEKYVEELRALNPLPKPVK